MHPLLIWWANRQHVGVAPAGEITLAGEALVGTYAAVPSGVSVFLLGGEPAIVERLVCVPSGQFILSGSASGTVTRKAYFVPEGAIGLAGDVPHGIGMIGDGVDPQDPGEP